MIFFWLFWGLGLLPWEARTFVAAGSPGCVCAGGKYYLEVRILFRAILNSENCLILWAHSFQWPLIPSAKAHQPHWEWKPLCQNSPCSWGCRLKSRPAPRAGGRGPVRALWVWRGLPAPREACLLVCLVLRESIWMRVPWDLPAPATPSFEGGSSQDFTLTVGSDSWVPGGTARLSGELTPPCSRSPAHSPHTPRVGANSSTIRIQHGVENSQHL